MLQYVNNSMFLLQISQFLIGHLIKQSTTILALIRIRISEPKANIDRNIEEGHDQFEEKKL